MAPVPVPPLCECEATIRRTHERDCPKCYEGEVECDYGHWHKCPDCDGSGKVGDVGHSCSQTPVAPVELVDGRCALMCSECADDYNENWGYYRLKQVDLEMQLGQGVLGDLR